MKRDTLGSLSSFGEDWSGRGSAQSNPVLVLPYRSSTGDDMFATTVLSPPPVPRSSRPRQANLHLRLRNDSGLSLHTYQPALRQYTDYNKDGLLRPPESRPRPLSFDVSTMDTLSLRGRSTEAPRQSRPLPDLFDHEVIRMAFSDPTTGQRLCDFAKRRHYTADMEFLLKVDEYSRAVGNMTSLINHISTNFTGITATSPLGLPLDLSDALKVSTKHCARSALPLLERLYRDAKDSVEDRLARDLYPDFVKFQLTQCVTSSISASRSLTGGFKSAYPGLGEAFCLTDPHKAGNPIVFASDGLLRLTGYRRREMMNKNCRMMQGMYTDSEATQRIRDSLALGQETVELIVNHRKDGTPFWNLLFICPLLERGSVRYHLGAQINVSESMGTDLKDILRILNFALPGEEFPPAAPSSLNTQDRPVWREPAPVKQERISPEAPQGLRSPRRSHRYRFFRRFSRKSKTMGQPQPPLSTTPVITPPVTEDTPSAKRRAFSTRNPQLERQPDEYIMPYSRFLVMRYHPKSRQSHHSYPLARMPIAFCSALATETLGLRDSHSRDVVLELDIFAVLAKCLNSPGSANRGLKATVLEKMAAGEAVSVDLVAPAVESVPPKAAKHSRNGSMMRAAAAQVGGVAGASVSTAETTTDSFSTRPRLSDTFDRRAEILSHAFFGHKTYRLVGHWAPLRDGNGEVAFVVLVLTPGAVA